MNDFYTQEELDSLGFGSLGEDVRLSRNLQKQDRRHK